MRRGDGGVRHDLDFYAMARRQYPNGASRRTTHPHVDVDQSLASGSAIRVALGCRRLVRQRAKRDQATTARHLSAMSGLILGHDVVRGATCRSRGPHLNLAKNRSFEKVPSASLSRGWRRSL